MRRRSWGRAWAGAPHLQQLIRVASTAFETMLATATTTGSLGARSTGIRSGCPGFPTSTFLLVTLSIT